MLSTKQGDKDLIIEDLEEMLAEELHIDTDFDEFANRDIKVISGHHKLIERILAKYDIEEL